MLEFPGPICRKMAYAFFVLGAVVLVASGCRSRASSPKTLGYGSSKQTIAQAKELNVEIAKLEDYVRKNPRGFNWKVHNDLRHLYSGIDERKSLEQSDIILKNSILDDYILRILSRWRMDKDTDQAISNLLYWTDAYPEMQYVQAACWLKAGDLFNSKSDPERAREYYRMVLEQPGPELARYRALAEARLSVLGSEPPP